MSRLGVGDDDMHYSDNSHRWIAPPGTDQYRWSAQVRAHMAAHLSTMGGSGPAAQEVDEPPALPTLAERRAAAWIARRAAIERAEEEGRPA